MIRTIIFDIGNVLAHYRWKEYLHSFGFSEEVENAVAEAVFLNPIWKEFDRGAMADEEIIDSFVHQRPEYEKEIRKMFEDMTELVMEYDYSVNLVRDLKRKGYRVYVLSNYGRTLFTIYAQKNFQFLNEIDGGVISYQVQSIKPEETIYNTLFERYQINPEEAVFLDDTVENLEAAMRMGVKTVHVTSYASIINGLQQYGVM